MAKKQAVKLVRDKLQNNGVKKVIAKKSEAKPKSTAKSKNKPKIDLWLIVDFIKSLPSLILKKIRRKIRSRKIPGSPESFKLQKRQKKQKVDNSTKLIYDSLKFLKDHWKTFIIILFVYVAAYFVLAYATPNIDLPKLIKEAQEGGDAPGVVDKVKVMSSALFTYRGEASSFARWAQFFLAIIFSLVFIYAIRHLHKGVKIRARDALYAGTTNVIPFFITMSFFAIQLLPLTFLGIIFGIGRSRGLFIGNLENYTAMGVLAGGVMLTFYFIPTIIISLYAVTIPGVYPMNTMRAVRIMVSQRRLEVVKNLLVFVIFVFLSYIALLALLVTYLPRFANLSLDLFFLIALPVIHTMMYKLYLKLLETSKSEQAELAAK